MDALHLLLNRHSCGRLAEPAPSGEVLDNILKAGLRAPDHGTLTPWQFILFEGEGRERLGTLLADAAHARGEDADSVEKCRAAPLRAPLVIAVATRYQAHPKVPKLEQELSAGCALMAMQMAAQAQGFNGIWRSGWFIFDEQIHGALELAPEDQLVGFLYLGTPMLEARKLRELPIQDFVRSF
ncbi:MULTISPECIES: NAD(P)H nitroreductase [Aeromonas]|uniref:Putative NAD(P)H nitroreductase n=1 Tax=Aeromonas caviae TaxID=648 RepID=A0AA42R9H3_AERCA|nr:MULTISPECIES: NAD(P)H nitroreductase [Aeromonas]MBS4706367.1 NAD(P)H nitroreductase [Aeromonas caviae]MDH1505898.1 NAD(P)H nitroreductase [Aeromonas caviae]MDH1803648.1 NAD(P)H nitroreductase [Aeromonas caviae]MDU7777552.1 NAD(P)H nitroreductase [Aeromonas caviae]OJW68258.1 MAG: nitroreductase [Aeromonas sp. 62-46]